MWPKELHGVEIPHGNGAFLRGHVPAQCTVQELCRCGFSAACGPLSDYFGPLLAYYLEGYKDMTKPLLYLGYVNQKNVL